MNSEKSLIDSFLAFNVNNPKSKSGDDSTLCDDTRTDGENGEESPNYRRLSDPPSANDSLMFGAVPTGVGGSRALSGVNITNPEQQLSSQSDIFNPSEYGRTPPPGFNVSSNKSDEFNSDSFALGAMARFNNEEEGQNAGARFPNIAPIETSSYIIREPEDPNRPLGRTTLSSKDLSDNPDEMTHFGREYNGFEQLSGRSNATASTSNGYSRSNEPSPRHYSPRAGAGGVGVVAPVQEAPLLSQYQQPPSQGYSSGSAGASPAYHSSQQPQEYPVRGQQQQYPAQHQQVQPYQQQVQQQRYPGQAPPQQQYARGGRSPVMADPYYPAPQQVDPYAAYKQPPYQKQPYNQGGYRQPAPQYGAPMDPYGGGGGGGYGAPPPPQYAPRYAKPAPQMGYGRGPYGREEPDPYNNYRGAPQYAPPAPYGYAPQYPEDPYANTGAAAVNRVLGRPAPMAGGPGDGYGPPSYRNAANARLRDRSLAQAEPVNLDNIDPNTIVYQVQFKKTIRNFTLRPGDLTPVQTGDFVIVQADRGEDLGVITDSYPLQTFIDRRYAMRAYMDEEDQNVGYILRVASPSETKLLPEKFQDEEMIFKTCENLAIHTYRLPMTVVDVEYQFDRHKITIYYDSPLRIDFRELVRDLFSSFKARIWMKKINQFQAPDIQQFAAIALATGVQLAAGND